MKKFILLLADLDRRVIFLLMALVVAIPMVFPVEFPIIPGKNSKDLFDFIGKLPEGTRTYVSFDYDPASMPEIHPAAIALLVHMFRRNLKPICGANWQVGGELAQQALASATEIFQQTPAVAGTGHSTSPTMERTLQKGRDYVNLGFKPGGIVHLKRLIADFLSPFPTDIAGTPTRDMEIFRQTEGKPFSVADLGIIISLSGGNHGIEDFISISGEHKRPMGTACTSVKIPKYYTYLQTGQLVGMSGGMPGAADYEKLINYAGSARQGMTSQCFAHLLILLLIFLGNLVHWQSRQKK